MSAWLIPSKNIQSTMDEAENEDTIAKGTKGQKKFATLISHVRKFIEILIMSLQLEFKTPRIQYRYL